jgi:type VI secretion system protein ImpH
MPTAQRRHASGVIEQLLHEPQQFGFFQAVRLLDRWLSTSSPDGQGLSLLNFRNSLSLAFPASEIESLAVRRRAPAGQPVSQLAGADLNSVLDAHEQELSHVRPCDVAQIDITPAFMGMLGSAGTLPSFYTEMLAQRELYQKDFAARSFLDVFSHRAVSLFYQAWRKHRLPIQFEADRHNRFLPIALSLAGVGQAGLRDRLGGERGAVADEALAFYAGALQQRTLSVKQLQGVLQGYLAVPVRIDQFVGRWYQLPESGKAFLGLLSGAGGTPPLLGRSAMLGDRVWQRDLRMRLVLGPLSHQRFQHFLPGANGADALKQLLTLLGGVSLEYEICLILRAGEVSGSTLESTRPETVGRLGWDTFLQTQPANDDRADVRYDIHAAA